MTHNKELKEQNKKYSKRVEEAVDIIKKYQNQDYIVFYNPTWLGVAASTKGLFQNIVPLEHIYEKKDIQKLAKVLAESKIKSVIFSQICDGWTRNNRRDKKD